MDPWLLAPATAALAVVGVYAYAAAALHAHARLAGTSPPRTLPQAIATGALLPACGCTALPYARRAPHPLRAPFLIAAYAVNPLILLAALLLGGPLAALTTLGLGLAAAALAAHLPAGATPPRARLDDLLLRPRANPLRDALPYAVAYALPALGVGAIAGAATLLPTAFEGALVAPLALLLGPPHRDVAADHGPGFARRLRAVHAAFAASAGAAAALAGAILA